MSDPALLQPVQYVVDAGGHKSAGSIALDVWEQILTLVEDVEDAEKIRQAWEEDEEAILWRQMKADLGPGWLYVPR